MHKTLIESDLEKLAKAADLEVSATTTAKMSNTFASYLYHEGANLLQISQAFKMQGYDVHSAYTPVVEFYRHVFENYDEEYPYPTVCGVLYEAGYKPEDILRAVWNVSTFSDIQRTLELGREVLGYLGFEEPEREEILGQFNIR